jgi:tripartite-type tricarboxylate transporter receptor subunit TctC
MKKHVSMKLVLLGVAVAFTLAVTSTASAQPGEFVKGVLQPLADGFPKQRITLVVIDDPGSRDDIYAKTLQQSLRGISPVDIVVTAEPIAQGGTFNRMEELTRRKGNSEGYYPFVVDFWGASTDPLIEPITEELGVTVHDLQSVIITDGMGYWWVQHTKVPWGPTWADFLKYVKAHPGEVKYGSSRVGSGTDIACSMLQDLAGIYGMFKKVPAGGGTENAKNIAAGAVDFGITDSERMPPHYQAGRMIPIMYTGTSVPSPYDKETKCITWEEAGLSTGVFGQVLGLGVTADVPKSHVNWLYKLFKAGASTDLHKKRETTFPGLKIDIKDPAEADKFKMKMYTLADPITRKLGIHLETRKKK